jgi:tetratricopeptide (TPR) repeat protein
MNLRATALLLICLLPVSALSISSKQLAAEQEVLYKRLASKDQLRPIMALRLADLLFDASTEVEKGKDFTSKQAKEMEVLRLRAIELYEGALSGFSGTFATPKGSDALRIQFQLARLYMDQGYAEKADRLWESLAAQTAELRIRKESALRRAEKLELSSSIPDLQKAKSYYDIAFANCGTKDLCSYILYRRGWIYHRLGSSDLGLQDLLKSLESTEAGSVADIIKDIILFLSHSTQTPEKSVALIEKIGAAHRSPCFTHRTRLF